MNFPHSNRSPDSIPTGFAGLDLDQGVLRPGSVTVIAGRPAMGVTTLALQILAHAAQVEGVAARYVYPRRPKGVEPPHRWVAIRHGEDPYRVALRGYDQFVLGELVKHPNVLFQPCGGLPCAEVVEPVLEQEGRTRLAIVDLRPAITPQRWSDHLAEFAITVYRLEQFASTHSVAVVLLSSLPRSIDRRRDKRPELDDVQRAGIPREYVDVAVLLYRDGYYGEPAGADDATEVQVVDPGGRALRVVHLGFGRDRFVELAGDATDASTDEKS